MFWTDSIIYNYCSSYENVPLVPYDEPPNISSKCCQKCFGTVYIIVCVNLRPEAFQKINDFCTSNPLVTCVLLLDGFIN